MRFWLSAFVLSASLFGVADAFAGDLRSQKLSAEPTSLLGGRLTMRLPNKMKMPTVPSDGYPVQESRGVLTVGGEQMMIIAQEVFTLAPNGFEKAVRGSLPKKGKYKVEALALDNKSLRAYAVWPQNLNAGAEYNLVMTMFVAHKDRTMHIVNFLVNGAAADDAGGSRVLVKRIARTLSAGKTRLKRLDGKTHLTLGGTDQELTIDVPSNTVLTRDVGLNYVVYQLRQLITLGETTKGALEVQLGGRLEHRYIRAGGSPETTDGKLLGNEAKWHEWSLSTDSGEVVYIAEAMTEVRLAGGDMLPIHVSIVTSDRRHLKPWRGVVASMRATFKN